MGLLSMREGKGVPFPGTTFQEFHHLHKNKICMNEFNEKEHE